MGKHARWMAVLGLICLVGTPALAKDKDSDEPIVTGELGTKLAEAVDEVGGGTLWGAVLVAKDGEILLAKGYGAADYKDTPNTPRTLFELASASKQVCGAAILHLKQRRKLKLDDSIDEFFEDVPDDKKGITVHHLLTHTSGLSDELGVSYGSPIQTDAYIEKMLEPPIANEPGEVFAYSNVGYALLAAIVEKKSKMSFEKYCEKYLFKPAKMKDTGFIKDKDLIKTGRASTRKAGRGGGGTAVEWHYGWGYRGMGGVVTTVLDMHRWDRAMRGEEVLEPETQDEFYTPHKNNYACGWRVETTDRGTRKAHHSGGVAGYGTNVVRYLEDDALIVVLSNDGQSAFNVTRAVEKVLFDPVEIEVVIDTKGYDRGSNRIIKLPEEMTWKVKINRRGLTVSLHDEKRAVLEVKAPKTYANKLADALAQAVAAREADDDGTHPPFEAGLYLQAFNPSQRKIEIRENVRMEIRSEYRGQDRDRNPVIDKRVLVRIEMERGWPFMAKMNVDAAKQMLEAFRKAMK